MAGDVEVEEEEEREWQHCCGTVRMGGSGTVGRP